LEVDERRGDGRKRGKGGILTFWRMRERMAGSQRWGGGRGEREERDDREGDFFFGNCPSGIQRMWKDGGNWKMGGE
jgi:hypothetical protein